MRSMICLALMLSASAAATAAETLRARPIPVAAAEGVYGVTIVRGGNLLLVRANSTDGVARLEVIDRVTHTSVLAVSGAAADDVVILAAHGDDDAADAILRSVAVRTGGVETRRLVDAISGREITDLAPGETPRLVLGAGAELRVVTEQGVLQADQTTALRLRVISLTGSPVVTIDIPGEAADAGSIDARIRASMDGRRLVIIRDGVLHIADTGSGRLRTMPRPEGTYHTGADFSDDGRKLYVALGIGGIRVLDTETLVEMRRYPDFSRGSLFTFTERAAGDVIEIGGRRLTIMMDANTGKHVWHARGSSVNSYRLTWLQSGHVLRASRSRSSPITYGVYKHVNGGFDLLFKREWVGGRLGALVSSPNGRCMLLSSATRTAVLAPASGKEIARVGGLDGALEQATISADGRDVVAVGQTGALWQIALPAVCGGVAGRR